MTAPRERDTRIPRKPFLWLAAALFFTLPPMVGNLAVWVPALFLVTLAAKFWMEPRGIRLRSVALKLVLAVATLAAIAGSYGSLRGIEAGVSLLVVLMSLKILEAHTAREFQMMVLVAWVLCLCGFIMSQELAVALSLIVAFVLLTAALIQFHRGSAAGAFWPPLRMAAKLAAQALPIIALLFLLFPRATTGFRFPIADSASSSTGFSETLEPGSFASVAGSNEIAFRAEFPDGKFPPRAAMYWRGAVMEKGKELSWRADAVPSAISASMQRVPRGEGFRQKITIEPHNAHWMFALDWPARAGSEGALVRGNVLRSWRPIRRTRQYEVSSFGEIAEKELGERERERFLEVPETITPAVRALAQAWSDQDPRTVVKNALQFFGTQGFRYSLSPGEYKENGLEEFLLRRRLGFCEHYAAGFATMMRLAGIPSRVVVGYLGGDFNAFGGFFLVRQSDAHAWCEVWLPDVGWQRVDPTGVVAPERINLGFQSFLERQAAAGQELGETRQARFTRNLAQWPGIAGARSAWETLNYSWDTSVLSFDAETQQSFLSALHFRKATPLILMLGTVSFAAALLALYIAWMRLRSRPLRDEVQDIYRRFCDKAARLGVTRGRGEGPVDFSERAAEFLPTEAERIRRVTDTYITLRYAPRGSEALLRSLAADVKDFAARRR